MPAFDFHVRDDALSVTWPDGVRATFPWLWLIDNEPAAFHPKTEERFFDLLSAPDDIKPLAVEPDGEAVRVTWPGRTAPSRIEAGWLRANAPGRPRPDPAAIEPVLWRGADWDLPRFPARDLLASDAALRAWLEDTIRYGLSLVTGIEGGAEAGVAVAKRAGFLRRTNFGATFEVISKPDPNNLAYTSHALKLHTDLANQEVPPGYQFLHCIANGAAGGGSVFCDGFAAAADLRRDHPSAFATLSEIEIPFRFHDRDYDIRGRYPVIVLGSDKAVREIRFNAHLVDVVDLDGESLAAFYRAYRTLMRMLRDPASVRAFRLQAGEMVVFDNRRVLHGREAFDPNTGFRHLNGCYVDRGEFLSRVRVLARG